jgi:hypothetical protein
MHAFGTLAEHPSVICGFFQRQEDICHPCMESSSHAITTCVPRFRVFRPDLVSEPFCLDEWDLVPNPLLASHGLAHLQATHEQPLRDLLWIQTRLPVCPIERCRRRAKLCRELRMYRHLEALLGLPPCVCWSPSHSAILIAAHPDQLLSSWIRQTNICSDESSNILLAIERTVHQLHTLGLSGVNMSPERWLRSHEGRWLPLGLECMLDTSSSAEQDIQALALLRENIIHRRTPPSLP